MKTLTAIAAAFISVALVGCSTPADVRGYSDYRVCRSHILRPPLASQAALQEANNQVRIRNLDCSKYAAAIIQEDANVSRAIMPLAQPPRQATQTQCWREGIYMRCTTQ